MCESASSNAHFKDKKSIHYGPSMSFTKKEFLRSIAHSHVEKWKYHAVILGSISPVLLFNAESFT